MSVRDVLGRDRTRPGEGGSDEHTTPRALIFGIVAMALLMGSIDQTIVATGLKTIDTSLHARLNWGGWTITAYQLAQIVTLPVVGRISDQLGRRRVFLFCVVLFTVSSMLCAMATNIYMLVGLRALQAVGGGGFMPSATGIVSDNFGKDRDRAIGMFTSILPLGALIGPVIGGIIIADWFWRGIFYINVPIGAVLLVLGLRFLPVSPPKGGRRPDLAGAVLLGTFLLALMFGITSLGDVRAGRPSSFGDPQFIVPEVLALVLGAAFVHHTRRVESPIIPIHLLKRRTFATMNFVAVLYGGCALGFSTLVPLYAEDRYHIHVFQAGTILTARAIGSVAVAGMTSMMLRRVGYRLPMVIGFLGAAGGLLLLAIHPVLISTYAWLAVAAMIMGLGNGIAAPATSNALLSQAPDQVAAIAGLRSMFRQIGGLLTISIATAIIVRSPDEGLALSHALVVFALALSCVVVPLVFTVPEHRGNW